MTHSMEAHHPIERDRIETRPTVVYGTRKTCGQSLVLLFALFFPRLRRHNGRASQLILLSDIERLVEE